MRTRQRVSFGFDWDLGSICHGIVKIILNIIGFSTINYTKYENTQPINLIDLKTIIDIQDTYTELAWQYLVYKYTHLILWKLIDFKNIKI